MCRLGLWFAVRITEANLSKTLFCSKLIFYERARNIKFYFEKKMKRPFVLSWNAKPPVSAGT